MFVNNHIESACSMPTTATATMMILLHNYTTTATATTQVMLATTMTLFIHTLQLHHLTVCNINGQALVLLSTKKWSGRTLARRVRPSARPPPRLTARRGAIAVPLPLSLSSLSPSLLLSPSPSLPLSLSLSPSPSPSLPLLLPPSPLPSLSPSRPRRVMARAAGRLRPRALRSGREERAAPASGVLLGPAASRDSCDKSLRDWTRVALPQVCRGREI